MTAPVTQGLLHHVEYYVEDRERSDRFWSWMFGVLGWSLRSTWANGTDWVHPSGTYLVFAQVEDAHRGRANDRQAAGLNHLAFRLETSVSRDELARQLVARGATIVFNEPDYLCFEDPNRFAVELYLVAPSSARSP